jgi:DNA replication protein DnaC
MDDSARLRAEVERRAAARVSADRRAAIKNTITQLAHRHGGVDPRLLDMTNADNRARADRLLAEKEAQLVRDRLERQAEILVSRLPAEYQNARLPDEPWVNDVLAWLHAYRQARQTGSVPPTLTLMGPVGSGKTWTAAALARILLVEDSVPVTFVTTQQMIDAVKPAHSGLDVDMVQFELAPVLVLDDFGAERLTEWAVDQLYRLAHHRSHNGRPCIITTNLDGPDIRKRYNERLIERLFGGSQLVRVTGVSRRKLPF